MDLYHDNHRLFHFATIDFPPRLPQKLAVRLLELFQMHDRLKDTFFVHELRGTKSATHHDPKDTAQRWAVLEDMFYAFNTSQLI